jgi:hypothetical protein
VLMPQLPINCVLDQRTSYNHGGEGEDLGCTSPAYGEVVQTVEETSLCDTGSCRLTSNGNLGLYILLYS